MANNDRLTNPDGTCLLCESEFHMGDVVHCDENCGALYVPDETDINQVIRAYHHWRFHSSMDGCSHAC